MTREPNFYFLGKLEEVQRESHTIDLEALSETPPTIDSHYTPPLIRPTLSKRENHSNMGYHCHIMVLKGNDWKRTNYVVTFNPADNGIYAYEHGANPSAKINLEKERKAVIKGIKKTAGISFKNKNIRKNAAPVPEGATKLFEI